MRTTGPSEASWAGRGQRGGALPFTVTGVPAFPGHEHRTPARAPLPAWSSACFGRDGTCGRHGSRGRPRHPHRWPFMRTEKPGRQHVPPHLGLRGTLQAGGGPRPGDCKAVPPNGAPRGASFSFRFTLEVCVGFLFFVFFTRRVLGSSLVRCPTAPRCPLEVKGPGSEAHPAAPQPSVGPLCRWGYRSP